MVIGLLQVALAATVTLSVATDTFEVDQTIQATVTVLGAQDQPRAPAPADSGGLAIGYVGPSSFTQVVGRRVTIVHSFNYAVTGTAEGTWTVGPFDVYVDGTVLSTDAIEVTVGPRTEKQDQPAIELYADVPTDDVWQGQVLLYRYGFTARVPVSQDLWALPPFEHLPPPRDGLPVSTSYVVQDPTGPITRKETFQPLMATASGPLSIGSATATLRVPVEDARRPFGFLRTREVTLTTDRVELDVKPLPPAPPGFAGLVGDFVFDASVDRTTLDVGESAAWTVSLRGDGSLEGFALPEPPETEDLRFYDSVVGADARILSGRYQAAGQWQRVIVPTRGGTVEVPPIELVYFSPSRGEYVTERLVAPALTVRGDVQATSDSFGPAAEPPPGPVVVDNDIRPIWPSGSARAWFLGPFLPLALGLAALPALGVAGAAGVQALRRRLDRGPVAEHPLAPLRRTERGTPARLAALDAALRGLDGDDVAALREELGRARFADGVAPADLDDRATALLEARLGGR